MSSSRRQHLLGTVYILTVVGLWQGAAFLTSYLAEDADFRRPFFITFVNTSSFTLYLLPYLWTCWRARSCVIDDQELEADAQDERIIHTLNSLSEEHQEAKAREVQNDISGGHEEGTVNPVEEDTIHLNMDETVVSSDQADAVLSPTVVLNLYDTFQLSFQFCLLWFAANLTTNASYTQTNVASSTVLASTSSVWTLLIGWWVHVEHLSTVRVFSTLLRFVNTRPWRVSTVLMISAFIVFLFLPYLIGVALVSFAPASSSSSDSSLSSPHIKNNWRGDLLALAGAILYGSYITLLKLRLPPSIHLRQSLFFGIVGALNILFLLPVLLLLHFMHWETLTLPETPGGHSTAWIWLAVAGNALLGTCLSEWVWLKAMLYTTPLMATVGMSLSIPLAVIGDWLFKGLRMQIQFWVGALLIVLAFVLLNWAHMDHEMDQRVDQRVVVVWQTFIQPILPQWRGRVLPVGGGGGDYGQLQTASSSEVDRATE